MDGCEHMNVNIELWWNVNGQRKTEVLGENPSSLLIHYKSHVYCSGIKRRLTQWETSDYLLELWSRKCKHVICNLYLLYRNSKIFSHSSSDHSNAFYSIRHWQVRASLYNSNKLTNQMATVLQVYYLTFCVAQHVSGTSTPIIRSLQLQ